MVLTEKQKLFADEYLIDLNATRAYKDAYKSCKKDETARVNGSKALTNTNIKSYIDERMIERQKRTEISQDNVLKELAAIAFAKASDYAKVIETQAIYTNDNGIRIPLEDDKGNPILVKDVELTLTDRLTPDQVKALSGIKRGKFGIEVNQCDKVKALELLGRHLGMFTDNLKLKGEANTEVTIKIGGEDYGD